MTEIDAQAMPVQSPDKAALYARYNYSTRTWTCNAYEDGRRLTDFDMHGGAFDPQTQDFVNPALRQAHQTALERLPGWTSLGPWTSAPVPAAAMEIEYRVALTRSPGRA